MPVLANTRIEESVLDLCYLKDDSASDTSDYSKYGSDSEKEHEDIAPDRSIVSSCYASNAFETQDVGEVQAKKDKYLSVKKELSELKRRGGDLLSQIDSNSSVVQQIDEQFLSSNLVEPKLLADLS
ncbi:hypothetical protein NL676_005899 [Syzygium grande]|nr:hypothetical protein NL676_005899 [Syzygium grande]